MYLYLLMSRPFLSTFFQVPRMLHRSGMCSIRGTWKNVERKQHLHRNQNENLLRLGTPVLLYGSECWSLRKEDERRLLVAEMSWLRRICSNCQSLFPPATSSERLHQISAFRGCESGSCSLRHITSRSL